MHLFLFIPNQLDSLPNKSGIKAVINTKIIKMYYCVFKYYMQFTAHVKYV